MLRILLISFSLALFACKKDEEDETTGDALGAPAVQPPVLNNLPAAMALWNGGSNLTQDEVDPRAKAIEAVLGYLSATNGFVTPTSRLGKIDERMAELDKRTQTSVPRVCLKTAAAAYTLPGQFPDGATFAVKMQCRDDLDGGTAQQLAFGLDETNFYLYERTSASGSNVSVVAKAPLDGSSVEVWQVGIDSSTGGATFSKIVGSNAADGIELSVGGEAKPMSHAMVCGVRIKTKGDLTYASGSFYAGTACGDAVSFCLGADGTELADVSQCEAAGITTFTLPAFGPGTAGITATNASLFVQTVIADIEDFTKGEEDE